MRARGFMCLSLALGSVLALGAAPPAKESPPGARLKNMVVHPFVLQDVPLP